MRAKEILELIALVANETDKVASEKIRIVKSLLSLREPQHQGEREVVSTKRRYKKRKNKYARWEMDQDKKLIQLVDQDLAWSRIAKELGRTKGSCHNRYNKLKKQRLHLV